MGLKILETSSYLPEEIITNDDFAKYLETSDEWISSRTGIRERRISRVEDTSQLAYSAVKNLNIKDKEKIDMVLVATFTADKSMPNISSGVQGLLGLKENIFAVDFNMACSGFVAGLNLIEKFLDEGRQAILIGAEVISKYLDKYDRNTVVLFGDGAGAVLIEKNSSKQCFESGVRSNDECLTLNYKGLEEVREFIGMKGKEVFRFAVEIVPLTITNLLKENNLDINSIDHVICHQANYRILNSVSKKTKIPIEKFFMNLDKYGNTSASSIPIALDEMNKKGILKRGEKIILVGFGAGLSWTGTLMEW
ncbi:beta-ketoacyl-ACP synthase 3 [Miniphocaeibacter halophilus]|uniref:Beta-ketoacyl-ACP synthase 3 n=1 Tax=Miniphocaeibacter halophilus TaxID=2931922 RepID=A0AC61MVY0_9FIRM|nr:beta-ketoacyl-ACP synthase 3 [Miniphocaeibacter halophilus]QQK08146.1 beta-ketoacyl-ACP synthase 3 [Miniphocaeibacter halophilus]